MVNTFAKNINIFEREINIGGMEAAGVGGGTFRFKVEPLMEILMANNTSKYSWKYSWKYTWKYSWKYSNNTHGNTHGQQYIKYKHSHFIHGKTPHKI